MRAELDFLGYTDSVEGQTFTIDNVKWIPFTDECQFYEVTTDQGRIVYVWNFLFKSCVESYEEIGYNYRFVKEVAINASGFILPVNYNFTADQPIIYQEERVLTRQLVTDELKGLGLRMLIVADNGILYSAYEEPFTMISKAIDNKGIINPRSSKDIIYKRDKVYMEGIGMVDTIAIFPPFRWT